MLLTTVDREQLQRASEVMLRPFDHVTAAEYLKCVSREIRPLLGAFAAICGARDPDGTVTVDSNEWTPEITRDFARWKLKDEGTERALTLGVEVVSMRRVIGDCDSRVSRVYSCAGHSRAETISVPARAGRHARRTTTKNAAGNARLDRPARPRRR